MNKPKKEHLEQGIQSTVIIAGGIHPALGTAFGLAAALFGPALERRIARADDILKQIKDNPNIFTPELLADEKFQDGLILFIEKYIRERNEDKLIIMRSVFAGFGKAPNLNEFPLEEMTDLVARLRFADIVLLKLALSQEVSQDQDQRRQNSFKFDKPPFNVSRLIYFGLLMEDRTKNGSKLSAKLMIRDICTCGFLLSVDNLQST